MAGNVAFWLKKEDVERVRAAFNLPEVSLGLLAKRALLEKVAALEAKIENEARGRV